MNLTRRRRWYEGDPPADPAPPAQPPTTPPAEPPGDPSWLPGRLERAANSAREALLKELGFEKPDDLKALVTAARQRDEAEKTEAQKAIERADKADADKAKLQADLDAYKQQVAADKAHDQRVGALTAAASKANAVDTADVVLWAEQSAVADFEAL